MKQLNIYIHIPFCFSKCPYCGFFSCTKSESKYEAYFEQLEKEIDQASELYKNRTIQTIYIGGGTPNLVPDRYITDTVKRITNKFKVEKNIEITIELYPQYIQESQLKEYQNAGINRLSIGLQSTHNKDLSLLSRRYTYEDFLQGYKLVKRLGFKDIGIDLIFGYPSHTLSKWKKTLELITNLDVQHVSAYSLEIEEGTVYGDLNSRNKLKLPSDVTNREMYHTACKYLNSKNLNQYEISNFAKKGFECKHNLNFWNYQDYLGLGAGAYSRIGNMKFNNPENIDEYISNKQKNIEYISEKNITLEKIILGLRLNKGIPYKEGIYNPKYMIKNSKKISLNEKGKDFYNIVVKELL